jgi:predicted transcriptional regulator
MGLEFAILSYGDRMTIGATCDPQLVPEPDKISTALGEAHEALRARLCVKQPPVTAKPVASGLRVADLMTRSVVTAQPWDSLAGAFEAMRRGRFRHLPIVADDGRLVGILTHRDLLAAQTSSLGSTSPEQREAYLSSYLCAEAMETHLDTTIAEELVREMPRGG